MKNFLDTDYQKRVSVLVYLSSVIDSVSLEELANKLNHSKITITNLIKNLRKDFVDEFPEFALEQTKDHKYYLTYNNQRENIFFEKLFLYYERKSLLFLMVEELFLKGKINGKAFCMKNYISQATFSRMKQRLRELLARCDIKLANSQHEGIVGLEHLIRSFFYQFYWSSYQTIEWPFELESYKKIQFFLEKQNDELFATAQIKNEQICYILFITLNRIAKGQHTQINFTSQLNQFSDFRRFSTIMIDFFKEYNLTEKNLVMNEISFLYTFFQAKELLNVAQIDILSLIQMGKIDSKTFEMSNLWLDEFSQSFGITPADERLLLLYRQVILIHLNLDYFFCDIGLFDELRITEGHYQMNELQQIVHHKVTKLCTSLMKNPKFSNHRKKYWKKIKNQMLIQSYYLCSYAFFYQNIVDEPVYLFVQSHSDYPIEALIQQKIKRIFGDRVEILENLTNQVEVIISDYFIRGYPQAQKVSVSTFSNQKKMAHAVEIIQDRIISKINQTNFL